MKVFLDANILCSAAKSDGAMRELLRQLAAHEHELWVDELVIEEARRNLTAKVPQSEGELDELLQTLRQARHPRTSRELRESLPVVEKDRPVLAAALGLRCEVLVTGDRTHFGALYGRRIHGVLVLSPREAALRLLPPAKR